jgi:formylmethanofuran dehydrogenase subunit E
MDAARLAPYPEIRNWFMRLVSKHDQDKAALLNEIKMAGHDILFVQPVRVSGELRTKKPGAPVALCASCGEAYPKNGSALCPACQGMDIYE